MRDLRDRFARHFEIVDAYRNQDWTPSYNFVLRSRGRRATIPARHENLIPQQDRLRSRLLDARIAAASARRRTHSFLSITARYIDPNRCGARSPWIISTFSATRAPAA